MYVTISLFGFGAKRQNCHRVTLHENTLAHYWAWSASIFPLPAPEIWLPVFKAMWEMVRLHSLGSDLCEKEQ